MTLRCLIVDDSPAFLAAARGLLERQGLSVAVASKGAQAVQLAEELRPDVVLLDIGLGGESGFDVARLLESGKATAQLPVILISTLLEDDYGELISTSPAVGFLPKIALSAEAITEVLRLRGTTNGQARTAQ
jgi:CheY-like chemotaxis protein